MESSVRSQDAGKSNSPPSALSYKLEGVFL